MNSQEFNGYVHCTTVIGLQWLRNDIILRHAIISH